MRTEIRDIWTEALRSDEYIQGTNQLVKNGKYCCLGVLTDLAVKAGVCEWIDYAGNLGVDGTICTLSSAVRIWAGLDSNNPVVYEGEERFTLAGLNDTGSTFNEIADIVDENL